MPNKDEVKRKAYAKQYREDNRDRLIQQTKDWMKCQGVEYRLFHSAKKRAKSNNIPFDIELSDVVVPITCPYLDIPIVANTGGKTHTDCSPSLDRVVPHLGYVKGNVQVISHKANVMKNSATLDELRTFSTNALRLH